MNQLGKNVILSLCVVATLLVIIGLKRKFSGGDASLLSQPSEAVDPPQQNSPKNSPRPRVLHATSTSQHDQAILSPTSPQYADSETETSPASGLPVVPVPTANSNSNISPRPLDAPDLVPVGVGAAFGVTDHIDDEGPESTTAINSSTAHPATRALPESVLTDADDSFWSISEKVYGTGVYYRALFRHNEAKVLRPDQLRAGIELNTPPLEVLREKYPADCPKDPLFAP